MKKTLSGVGVILIFLALLASYLLYFHGVIWLYQNFYQTIQGLVFPLFGFVILLSIFSLIPNLRLITGICIYLSSTVLGFIIFLAWFYTAYSFSGILGFLIPPYAFLYLLLHGEFLILGDFILGVILMYGISFLGGWVLMKYRQSVWLKKRSSYIRYSIAVIVGCLAGQFLAGSLIRMLAIIFGQNINNSYSLSVINIISAILSGFVTGIFAGLIAEKRRKLIAGISQFALLILFTIFELIINRDLSSGFGPYNLTFWTWVGLLPALIGGHYCVKIINEETISDEQTNTTGLTDEERRDNIIMEETYEKEQSEVEKLLAEFEEEDRIKKDYENTRPGLFAVMVTSKTESIGPFPVVDLYLVNNTDIWYSDIKVLTGALMSMDNNLMETSKSIFGPFELDEYSVLKIGGSDLGEIGDFIVWYDIDMDDGEGNHYEYRISLPKTLKLDKYPLEFIPILKTGGRILELSERKTGSIDDYIKEKGLESKYIEY